MAPFKNLAPSILRQRLIIEALTENLVTPEQMVDYFKKLAEVVNMEIINGPQAYSAHELGFGGWVHWRTSGATIYSYPCSPPLVTVDCYTCKPFDVAEAVKFTAKYFQTLKIVWQEI
ncbi:S-adenosylmethionine decarboxylase [Patescibacteria group bacterium]|nr:S-adenosylmethionine decarboxylase [Patescibacteria group bacterium]